MSSRRSSVARRLVSVSAGLVLAVPAVLLVAPGAAAVPGAHHHPTRAERQATMAEAVFNHLNHERALHKLPPLKMNADLVHSAHRHNLWMARFNLLSHQLPGEAYFATRILKAGYHWQWAGENIAWNSVMTRSGAVQLQQMMYHEKPPNDGHRVNILSTHFRNVGVNAYLDSKNHKVWLTTDFARRQ
jgi:uncharacterized protein YkwD